MVKVDTSEYRRSHGKEPRGWGGWMFAHYENGNFVGYTTHCKNYGEAKKEAMAYAKKHGCDEVRPQP